MDIIPLTTKETQHLRSQYPCIEHLEAGNVGSWLVERREQLLGKAEEERLGMNIVKTFGILATTAGALCYATSPLAPIGGIIAAVGYGWAVLEDMNASHKFAPLPFIRGSFIEFLSAMGDRSSREEYFASQNAEVDLIFHLDPFEQKEYAMLLEFMELVTEYLMNVEPGKRFYAYRWLLGKYRQYKALPDRESMAGHLENVEIDPRVEVEAIGQLQDQTEQKKLTLIEQQRARCVKLPNQPRRALPEEPRGNLPQPLGQALEVPSHPVEPSSTPFTTKLPDSPSRPVEATKLTTPATYPPEVTSRPIEPLKPLTIVLFDFNRLRTEPDKFAHLRVIGGTGVGKTTFVDWLLDVLGGSRFVITPKKKSWNWVGLKVYGLWFDYEVIRSKLQWIHAEMYRRYPLMEAGQTFELSNFVVDEWRLINTNVKAIKERDPETKQSSEIAPSAKAMMKDIITVARESMLRLIALAQGENVASWGFEGESDLEECFTDIRL